MIFFIKKLFQICFKFAINLSLYYVLQVYIILYYIILYYINLSDFYMFRSIDC